jgi:hypothetical protein
MSWLAHINESNGSIMNLQIEPATLKVELGLQPDGSSRFELIGDERMGSLTPLEFVRRNFYDRSSESFVDIGEPPNEHAYRDGHSWKINLQSLHIEIRQTRNNELMRTDWTQIPDAPLSLDMKNAWAGYRQELRDITENLDGIENLTDINWPTPPQ